MARKSQSVAAEALDEIQSSADRFAEWIRDNLRLVTGAIAALLLGSGLISWAASHGAAQEEAASTALFEARSEYLRAMGANLGAIDVPELANPEAAVGIREAFGEALASISNDYPGTTADFLSRLETGRLLQQGGDHEGALALYDGLADEGSPSEALRGLALQRAAQVLEDEERWAEAAARHESAAALASYPLRHWALADAARSRVAAGETARAAELYRRLDDEAPALRLPDAQRALSREIRALAAGAG